MPFRSVVIGNNKRKLYKPFFMIVTITTEVKQMELKQKQKEILRVLMLGDKRLIELKNALNYKEITLIRQLKGLEEQKYISHVHLNRTYKITSKGVQLLNELDTETKNDLLALQIFLQIQNSIEKWRMVEMLKNPAVPDVEKSTYIDNILKTIGASVIYTSIKSIEMNDPELLNSLTSLPKWITAKLKNTGLPIEQVRKIFDNKTEDARFDAFDVGYQMSREITLDAYKKLIEAYKMFTIPSTNAG